MRPPPRVLLIAAVTALVATAAAGPAAATFPGRNGMIAFTSCRGCYTDRNVAAFSLVPLRDLFPLRPTVPALDPVNYGARAGANPSFSPDGRWIAYTTRSSRIAYFDVVRRRVVRPAHRIEGTDPSWSPDGKWLALDGPDGIDIVRRDGTDSHRLTDGYDPTWSRTGVIAFEREELIYRIDPSGRHLRRLTPVFGVNPDWSPDGRRLSFSGGWGLFTMRADGHDKRLLSYRFGPPFRAVFSPDGRWILFAYNVGSDPASGEIRRIPAGGGFSKPVASVASRPISSLAWQPLGGPRLTR